MRLAVPASLLVLFLVATVLPGCGIEPKLTDKSVLSVDNWTRRNNPDIYITPMRSPAVPTTALMVPFHVTQDIPAAPELGEQITRIVWQTWTRDRVFPKLLYEPGMRLASTAQAVATARRLGVDLAIVGKITYLMSGGTRGDSGVAFSFEIIDVKSGERLWSMAHAGTMETGLTEDYILIARKNRMPTDPIYAITTTLAADMGGTIINWNYGAKTPPPAAPNPTPAQPQPAQSQSPSQPQPQSGGAGRNLSY
jgi:hypothetical protein